MKQVSLREFSLHPTQYLKELPITLTRYNLPVAVVSVSEEYKGISMQKEVSDVASDFVSRGIIKNDLYGMPVEVSEDVPDGKLWIKDNDKGSITEVDIETLEKKELFISDPTQPIFTTNCQAPQAKCLTPTSERYKITFKTDEGVETKEYALCEEHVKKAWKEGVRVEKI